MSRQNINQPRRSLLALLCGLPAFLVRGAHAKGETRRSAVVGTDKSPAPGDFSQAIHQALKGQPWQLSDAVKLEVPQIAENGAIVPITVESLLPNTRRILIFAEKNPRPLLAEFHFDLGIDPMLSLRVKLNESGKIFCVAESGSKYYSAVRMVRVLDGGCE